MKSIHSLEELRTTTELGKDAWLLLYKAGSALSDCAADSFKSAENETDGGSLLLIADVTNVRDIHTQYDINTVPALLHFKKGQLVNVVKGCHKPQQLSALLNKSSANLSDNGKRKVQRRITVYTTPSCTWCNTIKRYLSENGISYHEVDVSSNRKAAEEMVRRSGQQGVPQTQIDGEVIVGFDKARIDTLLGLN